jgi:hypothetical protein
MTGHLDLDSLADVLADEAPADALGHLAGCAPCRARLEDLRAGSELVAGALAGLPDPELPPGLVERLDAVLRSGAGAGTGAVVTTLPVARDRGAPRRLAAAAAAVVLLGGAGYGLSQLNRPSDPTSSTAAARAGSTAASPAGPIVRDEPGTDYADAAALAVAVPALLTGAADTAGTMTLKAPGAAPSAPSAASAPSTEADRQSSMAKSAADPLARLREPAGLADCLLALLPPDDPSVRPLALDYAAFRGTPALVVVLPARNPARLDVFVVGAGCSRADDGTLLYTSVPRG